MYMYIHLPYVVDFFLLLNSFINSGTGSSFFLPDRVDDRGREGTVPLRTREVNLDCRVFTQKVNGIIIHDCTCTKMEQQLGVARQQVCMSVVCK